MIRSGDFSPHHTQQPMRTRCDSWLCVRDRLPVNKGAGAGRRIHLVTPHIQQAFLLLVVHDSR